jgi:Stress responsive A/B Barrel Domain
MPFFHHVYFYPREGAQPGDADALEAGCRKNLSDIPGVTRIAIGRPAGTDRPVVDNDYAVALLLELTDADAEAAYQVHPQHLRFIEENKHLWSRVRVYDSNGK